MDWRTLDGHDKWDESERKQNGDEEEGEEESGEAPPSGEEGMDPKELEEEWKRRTATAAEIAKTQGDLPAGMERLVEDLIYPKIDWREQLQRFVISLESGQVDWTRPDPRYRSAGVYFPTSESKQLDIALAVDTSGSVNQEQLRDFLSEVKGALEAFPSFKARLLACDADVHAEVEAEVPPRFRGLRGRCFWWWGDGLQTGVRQPGRRADKGASLPDRCQGTFPEMSPPTMFFGS